MRLKPTSLIVALLAGLLLLAILFVSISYFRYTSEAAVKNYLRGHASDVAVLCADPSDLLAGFHHNAGERYPLASTFKIVLLAGYADQVAQGRLDPQEVIPLSELDRYFLPATDGGAHPQFLLSLGEARTSLTLREAVDGMMIYSSNAAADYIASRLVDADFPALYRRLGLEQTDLPFSYLGLYLFMANHETGEYAQEDVSLEAVRIEQQRLEGLFLNDPEWRAAELAFVTNQSNFAPVEIQKEVLNRYGMAGSARDMARVMLAAYGYNPGISPNMQQVMRHHLEWPMRLDPQNAQTFDVLAAKSGAWPGILTSAWYGDPAGAAGSPRVLSVLYRDMPDDFWSAWLVSFSQQMLETNAIENSDCAVFSDTIQ